MYMKHIWKNIPTILKKYVFITHFREFQAKTIFFVFLKILTNFFANFYTNFIHLKEKQYIKISLNTKS